LDLVASNYAVVRWNNLNPAMKEALPDVTHDNFEIYENHILKEGPLVFLYVVAIGFFVYYDCLGYPLTYLHLGKPFSKGMNAGATLVEYRRGEAWVRYFECRCVLELMRAASVWVTSISDPRGMDCMLTETHTIDNIWSHNTFARCGDNIYSGHASQLLSLAVTIQSYNFAPLNVGSTRWLVMTVVLWVTIVMLSFYIVVSRLHYTVDVMLAWFLVPMVWLSWNAVSGPSIRRIESHVGGNLSLLAGKMEGGAGLTRSPSREGVTRMKTKTNTKTKTKTKKEL
jgi:hypothetical protein